MKIFVKICGIKTEEAINAAIDAKVDALGFVFYENSPRNIDISTAIRISKLVPDSIKIVAVMLHPSNKFWCNVQDNFKPDVLQTDLEDFTYLSVNSHIEKWPVIREGKNIIDFPSKFVYEGKNSGKGQVVDWVKAAKIAIKGKMILAGGLSVDNVQDAVKEVSPYGVDVSSAVESKIGVKDVEKIKIFVERARTEN